MTIKELYNAAREAKFYITEDGSVYPINLDLRSAMNAYGNMVVDKIEVSVQDNKEKTEIEQEIYITPKFSAVYAE